MAIVRSPLTTVGYAVKDRIEDISLLPESDVYVHYAGEVRRSRNYVLITVTGQHEDSSTSRMLRATVTLDIVAALNTDVDTLIDMVNKIDGDEYGNDGIPSNGLHRWKPGNQANGWHIGILENLSIAEAFQVQPDVLQGQLVYQCFVERTR